MSEPVTAPAITLEQLPGIRGALIRYRVMAYLVGTLLIVLVLVGVPLKYFGGDSIVVAITGVPHGYLFMVLLVTAYDLGRRVHWPWLRLILIGLAGTVPFLSFVAEYSARKDVQARIRAVEQAGGTRSEPSTGEVASAFGGDFAELPSDG